MSVLARALFRARLTAALAQPDAMQAALGEVDLPDPLNRWLGRLKLLYGVPFNYLVPDEAMLPPESLRFFYLDINWINALVDGAFSIGRNLTSAADSASVMLDRSIIQSVHASSDRGARQVRARALDIPAPAVSSEIISGFILRSSLVSAYKNMGVNAYALGHTPSDSEPQMLTLLRLETLGPQSNTLICLVEGDAFRIDIHEAPEHLHYGIDDYKTTPLTANKQMHRFAVDGSSVTFKDPVTVDLKDCLRSASPRTLNMKAVADKIKTLAEPQTGEETSIDSAEIAFTMTEGVGMVSFYKKTPS